jgi:hypothetical protein
MKRRGKKRKKRGLARRYGHSMMGGIPATMSEVGIPVRVHGTLYVQPHADEAFIDTVAEVVEDMVPEVVEQVIEETSGEHDYWPEGA